MSLITSSASEQIKQLLMQAGIKASDLPSDSAKIMEADTALLDAVEKNNVSDVKKLLENGGVKLVVLDGDGNKRQQLVALGSLSELTLNIF